MQSPTPHAFALVLLAGAATAQTFENNLTQIPTGAPSNNSYTENVDFADVDGDGDFDVVFADGGNKGNERNRIWINQGGLQGGTIGYFVDETAARMPIGQDRSRDLDFVDIDLDGDFDLYVTNTSAGNNQTNRWFVNAGGAQGGTPGFFVEETLARWVNLGVNNGTTSFSSVAPSIVIPSGGFVDWSCDCSFGDLDNDGDMDLVHTTYGESFDGKAPTRLFLNDGAGFFEEFNPSGFQLTGTDIENGDPALWAQGTHKQATQQTNGSRADIADQPLAVEIGDLDGDLDLDLFHGGRNAHPRVFENFLDQTGGVLGPFRDVTYAVMAQLPASGTNYEQELGDLDDDDDLDIYGISWGTGFGDILSTNDGTGSFGSFSTLPGPGDDDSEVDFFDYDGDGDLDLFVANWVGQDRLFENQGPPNWTMKNVTGSQFPTSTGSGQGSDCCDVDGDGDYDVFVANDLNQANVFLKNLSTTAADVTAPRLTKLEQAPDRNASPAPTVVRVQLYDNSSWNIAQFDDADLEYRVDGGSFTAVDMRYSGGQIFRSEIPGDVVGLVEYRARATDEHGNTGLSVTLSYSACGSAAVSYCTAGTTASGCNAAISGAGTASATAASGFTLQVSGAEGAKSGIFFFGTNGRQANPWGNGASFQCVVPPVQRTGLLTGSGTSGACDGTFALDLNALWCPTCPKATTNPGSGALVQAQLWFRDPLNTSNRTTSLSDALELSVCP